MEVVYSWVKNIAFYMIFMTLLFQLLPGSSYHKYVRLFAGMVMIILVISPVMDFLNLEGELEGYFNSISLSGDALELKSQLEKADDKRADVILSEYKSAILKEADSRAGDVGLAVQNGRVEVVEDMEDPRFGMPESFYLEVWEEAAEEIIYIEPIIITGGQEVETDGWRTKETEDLKKTLMRLFNLSEDKVSVIYKK